jgi:K+-sensing histidine kinase KdpD
MKSASATRLKFSAQTREFVTVSLGAGFCAALAALMSIAFPTHSQRAVLPLLFIVVLIAISLRFGAAAAIIGGIAAAAVFALFLFAPFGSLRVSSPEAKTNLGWMLMIGIPASFFLATSRKVKS